jgi:hypothetical protein
LLAEAQLQLSTVLLQLAVADAQHATADAAARRPWFPQVEGVPDTAVVAYVDEACKQQLVRARYHEKYSFNAKTDHHRLCGFVIRSMVFIA